jgi:hypothetical protein
MMGKIRDFYFMTRIKNIKRNEMAPLTCISWPGRKPNTRKSGAAKAGKR